MSGRVSPTTAQHVVDEFGDRLALILDGGACHQGIESTVISLTEDRPRLLRPGAVPVDVLESLLGEAVEELPIGSSDISRDRFEAPGMMTSHYAPVTPVLFKHDYRSSEETDQRVGVLWFSSTEPEFPYETILRLSQNNDPLEIAPKLFASLRELDALKLNRIIVDTCPPKGLGLAVMDRLRRATVRT
jgi:L-threonylcarbamoyladenylate synthase